MSSLFGYLADTYLEDFLTHVHFNLINHTLPSEEMGGGNNRFSLIV
jgi:hypothetical protein